MKRAFLLSIALLAGLAHASEFPELVFPQASPDEDHCEDESTFHAFACLKPTKAQLAQVNLGNTKENEIL